MQDFLLSGGWQRLKVSKANFLELRKAEVQLQRIPKRRSSQKSYSTHFGE
jgi:hypothetical protein